MVADSKWTWLRDSFFSTSPKDRNLWLARFIWATTMCGRATYGRNPNEVVSPGQLRRFNELLHRASSYSLAYAEGDEQRLPEEALVSMMQEELSNLRVDSVSFRSLMRMH